jgi:type IX secretion system PorP/SprF family membrane protein
MRFKTLLSSLILVCLTATGLKAQDLHFTLWDMNPLNINPAFTGGFSGTFRVSGIYRDQWRSTINNTNNTGAWTTPSFGVDAPIIQGFRKNDWIGVGIGLFSHQAGSLDLGMSGFSGAAAYHLGLNKKSTSVLTIGVQYGTFGRNINLDNAKWGNLSNNNDFSGMQINDASFSDWAGGVVLKTQLNKQMSMVLGAAFDHLFTPDYTLTGSAAGGSNEKPFLSSVHGQFDIELNDKMSLTPQFYFQSTAKNSEILVQSYVPYKWNENLTFRPGVSYRLGDAVSVLLGADIKDNLRVMAAYDFNTSELSSATNGQGGFELAAMYIVKIFKKPDVKPAILCPTL